MGKLTYQGHRVLERGKGNNKRLIITVRFRDSARPDQNIIYGHDAILNAIDERQIAEDGYREADYMDTLSQCEVDHLDRTDLKKALELIDGEYRKRNMVKPKTKGEKRRHMRALING